MAFARGRRLELRLLLACLVAVLALAVRPASAMVLAPMCGVRAESIAAPPISRAAKEIPLTQPNCERKWDPRLEKRMPTPAPNPVSALDFVPRVPPVRYRLPPPPHTLTPVESTRAGGRAGHGRSIERPPRTTLAL